MQLFYCIYNVLHALCDICIVMVYVALKTKNDKDY